MSTDKWDFELKILFWLSWDQSFGLKCLAMTKTDVGVY
jgi:hypothetical protein